MVVLSYLPEHTSRRIRPLPAEPFEIRMKTELKVQPNSQVYLVRDKPYYSVPYTLIGKTLKVEYTRTVVAIYYDGKKVALHARSDTYGKYVTVASHLPSYYENYVNLSPEKYIDRGPRHIRKTRRDDDEHLYIKCLRAAGDLLQVM